MVEVVWLASYPRSGNTFLRTILFQCFGVRSASVYPNDLGQSPKLREAVGHIEHEGGTLMLYEHEPNFIKTHDKPKVRDGDPVIYVVRNGIDAVRSLRQFYRDTIPMEDIIRGWRFGTWSAHLDAWHPNQRPDTLLLRYEDMQADTGGTIDTLARFLKRVPKRRDLPPRDQLADGTWINPERERPPLTSDQMELFYSINGNAMAEYGY